MFLYLPKGAAEILLILANLLPIAGVLFWGWKAYDVVFVFWMENLVIGIVNVARILVSARHGKDRSGYLNAVFFLVHYGGFTAGHGIVVIVLLGLPDHENTQFAEIWRVFLDTLQDSRLWITIAALLVSHAYSFWKNFIGNGEAERTDPEALMSEPYKRVLVLHLAIVLGGYLAVSLGDVTWILVLFVLLKVGLDLVSHRMSHMRLSR